MLDAVRRRDDRMRALNPPKAGPGLLAKVADAVVGAAVVAVDAMVPVQAPAKQRAIDWLTNTLSAGPVLANVMKARAKAAGIRPRTLRRAAEAVAVRYVRNADKSWSWALPVA